MREDLDYTLQGRPWFIDQHFLAIKPWQTELFASLVDLTQAAVWVCLPSLPIEFYDIDILKKKVLQSGLFYVWIAILPLMLGDVMQGFASKLVRTSP